MIALLEVLLDFNIKCLSTLSRKKEVTMTRSELCRASIGRLISGMTTAAFVTGLVLGAFSIQVQAQNYHVLHAFSGELDGSEPWAGLTIDAAGNLYGTTLYAGSDNHGTVFKFRHSGSGWVFSPLYSFTASDGVFTEALLTI